MPGALAQAAKQVLAQKRTSELQVPCAASSSVIRPNSKATLRAGNACCKSMFQVFQMFHLDVASVSVDVAKVDWDVAMVVHVCCKILFLMFQLFFQTYVASVFI
jgi:hypothetical protein